MQTFAPYQNIVESAKCLDYRRLGKQRVETLQILNVLTNSTQKKGWRNHPAVKQWVGYENALVEYGVLMCAEWIRRGYNDTCTYKIKKMFDPTKKIVYPKWWGLEEFHSHHRGTLLIKDPKWYGQFGWTEVPEYKYWWPTEHGF